VRNTVPQHLLYVPTHRPARDAAEAYMHECARLSGLLNAPVPFVLIEATRGPWVPQHGELLRKLSGELGVPAYHVTVDAFERFLGALLHRHLRASRGEALYLAYLLQPLGTAYGAGPNKAALAGAALGATVLHRRDSDTLPPSSHDMVRFPGELEIEAIGKPLRDVALRGDGSTDAHELVRIVASAYQGDPPHDRRTLFDAGVEFAREIERLGSPDASDEELNESIKEYFLDEPQRSYDDDFLELDMTGRTEMGVSCLYGVWRELPEMPLQDTLGCDYMQKNLSYKLRRPVVFHSRKVRHTYESTRSARRAQVAVEYAMRDLRYLLLWRVWVAHNRNIEARPQAFLSPAGVLSNEAYADSFERARSDADRDALVEVITGFARVHEAAAKTAQGALADLLSATSAAAQRAGEKLIDEVLRGIDDFCFLVRAWPRLIDAAQQCQEHLTTHRP
jgi:Family of unknown function (DUF6271)